MKCRVLRFISLVMLLTHMVTIWPSLNNAPQIPNEQDMASLMATLEKMTKEESKPEASLTQHNEARLAPAMPYDALAAATQAIPHDELVDGINNTEHIASPEPERAQKTSTQPSDAIERLGEEGQQHLEYLKDPFINLLKSSSLTHFTQVIARQEAAQAALSSFMEYVTERSGIPQKSIETPPSLPALQAPAPAPLALSDLTTDEQDSASKPDVVATKPRQEQPTADTASPVLTGPVGMPIELEKGETFTPQPTIPALQPQSREVMPPLSAQASVTMPPVSTPMLPPITPSTAPSERLQAMPTIPEAPTMPDAPTTSEIPTMPDMPIVSDMPSIQIPSDSVVVQPEAPLPAQDPPVLQSQPLDVSPSYSQEQNMPAMPSQNEMVMHPAQPEQSEQSEENQIPSAPEQAASQPEPEPQTTPIAHNNTSEASEMTPPTEPEPLPAFPEITS